MVFVVDANLVAESNGEERKEGEGGKEQMGMGKK